MKPSGSPPSGFALIELMTALAILAILTMVAVPMYQRLQARAHQAETAGNLSRVFLDETAYFAEAGRFGSFEEIGFALHGVSRLYTYRSPASGGTAGSTGTAPVDLILPQGLAPTPDNAAVPSSAALFTPGSPASFTATATGNVDSDATIDQWHVNDAKRGLIDPDVDDSST